MAPRAGVTSMRQEACNSYRISSRYHTVYVTIALAPQIVMFTEPILGDMSEIRRVSASKVQF